MPARRGARLLHLDVCSLDDRRPARDLALDECEKRLRTALGLVGNVAAENEQALAGDVVIECLVECIDELVNDRLRRRFGREKAVPGGCLEFGQPCFDGRGYARQCRIPLGRRNRIDLDPARFEMRTAGDDIGAHVVDLTAYQGVHGRSTAVKGHERRFRAHDRIEQQAGGEEDRADAGMRLVERAGVRLQIGDEFLEVLRRKVLPGRDDQRKRSDQADRLEIGIRLVCEVRIERDRGGVRPHLTHQDGVTVRIGAHRPNRAGGAAGAGDVLHYDLLAQGARHVVRDDAGGNVGAAAGRERHDERDRASRIGLRPRDPGDDRERGSARRQMQELSTRKFHGVSSEMPATPSCGRTTNAFMLYDLSEYAEGTLKALDVAYWHKATVRCGASIWSLLARSGHRIAAQATTAGLPLRLPPERDDLAGLRGCAIDGPIDASEREQIWRTVTVRNASLRNSDLDTRRRVVQQFDVIRSTIRKAQLYVHMGASKDVLIPSWTQCATGGGRGGSAARPWPPGSRRRRPRGLLREHSARRTSKIGSAPNC